ncbi:helix-turn-helix domain-containing protein [Planktotalea arctica]|uniref:helix-turn-helix domain-containing protein n=1 Tax=Planktotalea arctica TaxID=1481893 RepID=UPI00321AF02D
MSGGNHSKPGTNSFRYHAFPMALIAECQNHRKLYASGNRKNMASLHEFDPARGYVALPSDIMDIEMSPGAFRLLVELCRMANRTGECWPSLGQLSVRIGRSKAAISGYITELRALELVQTLSQRMANGYNYRLKYCVTFWKDWRANLTTQPIPAPIQKDECGVQPTECRVNSKNHIHKKQKPSKKLETISETPELVSVFTKWSDLAKAAPFPDFNAPVPCALLEKTRNIVSSRLPSPLEKKVIEASLTTLWASLRVFCDPNELKVQSITLAKSGITETGLSAFVKTVRAAWQPHWRKPPSTPQFDELRTAAGASNRSEAMHRVLKQYLHRWELSQKKLQRSAQSPSLAVKQAA